MSTDIDKSQLLCRWIHSHEEDGEDRIVFRPSHFAFPPSRGRSAITFAIKGIVNVEHPGPDDRGATADGRWLLEDNLLTITATLWSGTFEVESVDENLLVLRRQREAN